ncbi:MAG: PAS domain S-box protein [Leptospirillia bacterium]
MDQPTGNQAAADAVARRIAELEAELSTLRAQADPDSCSVAGCDHLLHSVFETSPVMVAIFNTDFDFISVNRSYAEADGKTPDFFPGKNHFTLYPNEDNKAIFRRVVETGEPHVVSAKPFEYANNPERGVIYWDWTLTPLQDNAGRVTRLVMLLLDVTSRIRAIERARVSERRARGSERELASILDHMQETIYRTKNSGEIVRLSRSVETLLGYTPEELIGTVAANLYQEPSLREGLLETLAHQNGRIGDFETTMRRKDGSVIWVALNAHYYCGEDGTPQGIEGTIRDVTQRKEAEELRAHSEMRLAEAQAIAHLGSWEWDIKDDTLAWSDETYRIFGIEPIGSPVSHDGFLQTVHPDDRDKVALATHDALYRGLPYGVEHRVIRPDGDERVVRGFAMVEESEDGTPLRMIGAVQDVTELSRAEAEKEQYQIQLLQAQKMEAVGVLAGGVAHDFNNLLTTISGYVELAMDKAGANDNLNDDLMAIRQAAERAAGLTRQLLMFSRKQPMLVASLDMSVRVDGLIKMLVRLIGEDVEIHPELALDLWPVNGDGMSIDQMIMNLAINARDAMPDGGRVTLHTDNVVLTEQMASAHPEARAGRFVCVSVRDTGTGMEKEILSHIFEPFFTTKERGKGTGLGMSVAHGIAKQHGGWIEVESTLGEGSAFHIFLPAAHRPVPAPPPDLSEKTAPSGRSGNGQRVLVVEDETSLRRFAEVALTKNGYEVVACESLAQAREALENGENNFDLVFSDVVLPDGNGLQLARELRAETPNLPILLCSGYPDQKSGWSAIQEQRLAYLQKPYSLTQLLEAVGSGVVGEMPR